MNGARGLQEDMLLFLNVSPVALGSRELKGLFWQALVVGIAVAVIAFLWSNTVTNLSARRITTGFAFLGRDGSGDLSKTQIGTGRQADGDG